jgi:hypothetical protein
MGSKQMELCKKPLKIRSKYKEIAEKKCHKRKDHVGPCDEFHYLKHLAEEYPRLANKIKRDATKTTGASWKSKDAGPNRIDRWVMLQNDAVLLLYGIKMADLNDTVVAKLREKAATYDDCMNVAAKLTWFAYQMPNAPICPLEIREYLVGRFGQMIENSTKCIVCKIPLDFNLFENAQRGKAPIETAHSNPREHNSINVGFAHRECNIAQGSKTLTEFYTWIEGIISRTKS